MNNSEEKYLANGTHIKLKHFIYLDRSRLASYSSQFSAGIVQLRRLTESIGTSSDTTLSEQTEEKMQEELVEGGAELGLQNLVSADLKKANKQNTKTGSKVSKNSTISEPTESLSEEKIDHDNAYSDLELLLINQNSLHELKEVPADRKFPPLIKISAVSRFYDWDATINLLQQKEILAVIHNSNQIQTQGFDKKSRNRGSNSNSDMSFKEVQSQINGMCKVIENFSIGSITLHTYFKELNVLSSLNPQNLCMTRDQLRLGYVMAGDAEITIVGLTRQKNNHAIVFPGFLDEFNVSDLWSSLVGSIDLIIDPIAIYIEV